jgi:hypothetical protein
VNIREENALSRSLLIFAGVAGATYVAYKTGLLDDIGRWVSGRPYLDSTVAEKLPLVQDSETIRDLEGNYDLDGVSYDDEGVIVGSDYIKPLVAPI